MRSLHTAAATAAGGGYPSSSDCVCACYQCVQCVLAPAVRRRGRRTTLHVRFGETSPDEWVTRPPVPG